MRLLEFTRYCMPFLPEVASPDRRVPIQEKAVMTILALAVFLVCSQLPLYGIASTRSNDPFYWIRVILASNRGTLMELGIAPIVTSSTVLQLFAGYRAIQVDQNSREERHVFQGAQKLLGFGITLLQAIGYVYSGFYGNVNDIGRGNALLLVLQLFAGGVLVVLLDELLQKGYGLGSGISLFVATNICTSIVWAALSPVTMNFGSGREFEGAFIALFHLPFARSNPLMGLLEAFFRQTAPNLLNLAATVLIYCIVIYLQGLRIELPVKNMRVRGQQGMYPIKLFYTSNMPIILQSALASNVFFISQQMYRRYKDSMLVSLMGQWHDIDGSGRSVPVGGLAYYISPPQSITEILFDPLHVLVYITFTIGACAYLSKKWISVSGSDSKDVARQLREQQVVIKGFRDSSVINVLDKYIPPSAAFGGFCVGALTILADFLGAVGSGTGILLAVTIVYEYFEIFMKEQQRLAMMM